MKLLFNLLFYFFTKWKIIVLFTRFAATIKTIVLVEAFLFVGDIFLSVFEKKKKKQTNINRIHIKITEKKIKQIEIDIHKTGQFGD